MDLVFRKMHGLGNDFVVLDARTHPLTLSPWQISALADRRRGIGCDQVVVIEPSTEGADAAIRIFNPDGSEAAACGNATRCIAALLAAEKSCDRIVIRTQAGHVVVERQGDGLWRADMGGPRFGWADIPLAVAADTLHLPLAFGPVADPAACSMGNPHVTFFVEDLATIPVAELGPRIETHPLFPQRTNVGFAHILAPDHLRLVVWERGAGLTPACGSAACAALVNAHRRGLSSRRATISMPGGDLVLEWRPSDDHVLMSGPAAGVFTGRLDLQALPSP